MNEEQYRALCEACDHALLAPDSTLERVAIAWLHVIREHPMFLANYADLFERTHGIKATGRRWRRVLRNMAAWLRQLASAVRSDGQPWYMAGELPHRIDVLFVSHLLNASHVGQAHDFYFGEVPNALVAHGQSAVIALINHSGQPARDLANSWRESPVPRVVLSASLSVFKEILFFWRLNQESRRLRAFAKRETPGLARTVLAWASVEALSGNTLTTLRMASQIGVLVERLQPKAIVVTFEGHAWERVTFAAARRACPNVRCVGYQHAALFRLQHAVRRRLAAEYNPDQILTAGSVAKAQLERAPDLTGISISVLGSNRSFNGESRRSDRTSPIGGQACLVLPEGVASECHLLFEFSLACAQTCPQVLFIWRLHPVISYESLARQNTKLRHLPKNIVLSQKTFEQDLSGSQWALYRGTTAIVQALSAGLRPVYLKLPGEMTVDPLYELDSWRATVETVLEFEHLVKADTKRSPDSLAELDVAQKYCANLFLPFNHQVLIDSIGNNRGIR